MKALTAADRGLTEDQCCIYILRGFGCRLPDPPSIDHTDADDNMGSRASLAMAARESMATEDAHKIASIFYKTRKLLQDNTTRLISDDATVAADVFVRRLSQSGVTKGSDMWHPEVSINQICQSS